MTTKSQYYNQQVKNPVVAKFFAVKARRGTMPHIYICKNMTLCAAFRLIKFSWGIGERYKVGEVGHVDVVVVVIA